MKIIPGNLLLAFAGFLHLHGAASEHTVEVKMTNNHTVGGPIATTRREPKWMKPRENPPVFQGYEVFIRMCVGTLFVSRLLQPIKIVPGHDPTQKKPASVEVRILGEYLMNKGEFQPYDPADPPKLWSFQDYLFVTRQGTADIYWVMLQLKRDLTELYGDAAVKPFLLGEGSQRPRRAE